MKKITLKLASLLVAVLSISMFCSCESNHYNDAPSGGYFSSSHGLVYSGWKLTSIEPKFAKISDTTEGFTIQFMNLGQCTGYGDKNSFYSEHLRTDPQTSRISIPMEFVSNVAPQGRIEKRYFYYIAMAQYYQVIGDTILRLYPYPANMKIYLQFKNQYYFIDDAAETLTFDKKGMRNEE